MNQWYVSEDHLTVCRVHWNQGYPGENKTYEVDDSTKEQDGITKSQNCFLDTHVVVNKDSRTQLELKSFGRCWPKTWMWGNKYLQRRSSRFFGGRMRFINVRCFNENNEREWQQTYLVNQHNLDECIMVQNLSLDTCVKGNNRLNETLKISQLKNRYHHQQHRNGSRLLCNARHEWHMDACFVLQNVVG